MIAVQCWYSTRLNEGIFYIEWKMQSEMIIREDVDIVEVENYVE